CTVSYDGYYHYYAMDYW
nr:immunoglobulin heavy chain junction region [Mus musculus]